MRSKYLALLYFSFFDPAPSFDLDFPVDCDDEYWEAPDPAQAFQQPKGKPSLISAFIAYLRLCQVISFALRTIVRPPLLTFPDVPRMFFRYLVFHQQVKGSAWFEQKQYR